MNRMKRHWTNLKVPECYSPPSLTQFCNLMTSCLHGGYCLIRETAGACACISPSMSMGGNKFSGALIKMLSIPLCFFRQRERGCATGQRLDAGCSSACFTYLNTPGIAPHKIYIFTDRKMYTSQLLKLFSGVDSTCSARLCSFYICSSTWMGLTDCQCAELIIAVVSDL